MSIASGEGLPSSRSEERTPLRSLDNEFLHLPSATRLKIRSSLNAESTKKTNEDFPDGVPELHLHSSFSTKTIEATATNDRSTSQAASELRDVTFKSYICAGGEIEILNSMLFAEDSLVIPENCVSYNNIEEDTTITPNVIKLSCCEHEEHPYCNPEGNETLTVITNAQDLFWKPLYCDGSVIEVYDDLIQEDNQFLSLESQLNKSLNTSSVNSTSSDSSVNCNPAEHVDHPYCGRECDGAAVTEKSHNSEIPHAGLNIRLNSISCTGGELEVSDDPKFAEECVLFPDQHSLSTPELHEHSIDPSISTEQFDHPYSQMSSMLQDDISIASEILPFGVNIMEEELKKFDPIDESLFGSINIGTDGTQQSGVIQANEKLSSLNLEEVMVNQPRGESVSRQTQESYEHCKSSAEIADVLDSEQASLCGSLKTCMSKNHQLQETRPPPQDGEGPSAVDESDILESDPASVESPTPVELQRYLEKLSQVKSINKPSDSCERNDSALGSSGNEPAVINSPENSPLILKVPSEYSSIVSALQMGILNPVVRNASQYFFKDHNHSVHSQFLADDSFLEGEKSFLSPVIANSAGLLAKVMESPMPHPLLNSTAVACKPMEGPVTQLVELGEKAPVVPPSEVKEQVVDFPFMSDGPLQQQLRQMAEFLIFTSGKMGPLGSTAVALRPASISLTEFKAPPVECHAASVGTSPVKLVDRSLNTSGLYERKRVFSVMDSCTETDPLLWNLPPGGLEGLSKQELEQRLMSSIIMVEALVQQLTAARAHGCPSTGCSPSDLREKLVQTEHTELKQTTMYRDLYMEALSRIGELELDESFLQSLMQRVEDTRSVMMSLSGCTDAALSNLKQVSDFVREDHESLISHYEYMKSLVEKSKGTQLRMTGKVKEALQQRSDMENQMQEAFAAKEAAFNVMEQLRTHCATEISARDKSVESQQELLEVLKHTYPQQALLNKTYNEILSSASELLSQTSDEQFTLKQELSTVQSLVQRCVPLLLKLNEKAADALRERDKYMSAKDQAVEEQEQIEEELNEAHSNLQNSRDEIGDLNLQVKILTTEMGVLRQKLMEKEDETGQLERKVTELSATVSSTLASYTFLEQALAGETTKLQQSWKDVKEAKERVTELEASLDQTEQHRNHLSRALDQSEDQLKQLQPLTESQSLQIQQLQDVCTQLGNVREMNEFLLMENELAREQVGESEQLLGKNLQGLRERNIQCEDLKGEVCQLQMENKRLEKELETTKYWSNTTRLQLEERMAHAASDITLLHHTLCGLTNELHSALSDPVTSRTIEQEEKEQQPVHNMEHQHSSSSFVENVMLAITAEREEDVGTDTTAESVTPDKGASPSEPLFSQSGAFTRLQAFTPNKDVNAAAVEPEVEDQSKVAELLSELGSTVSELVNTLKLVQQRKDGQLKELQKTNFNLQVEHQASNSRHEAETFELEHQLSRLKNQVERGNRALEQKTENEKTLNKLVTDVEESQESLNKHKTDNNELRKELSEIRRALQQSKAESQFLLEELKKVDASSASPAQYFEEKINLLKEVEKLKASLQEVQDARVKLLDRAKRHQIIHQANQQKSENELQMLNNMINKIRETLLSVPEVVNGSKQLQQLIEYIG